MFGTDPMKHFGFIGGDAIGRDAIQITVGSGEDRNGLLFERQWAELGLLEQLGQPRAPVEQLLGRGIKV